MIVRFVRVVLLALVRLFYAPIRAKGLENLPAIGPAIVVSNHPNGLLDPIVVRLAVARPVHFLAKSTLFKAWIGRLALRAFGGIPVYRARDGESTAKNDRTFELCREHLGRKGWIALFPEGTSHSDPSLKPIKTGAARIALSAVAEGHVTGPLPIIPAGLYFEAKETFRTGVGVTVGAAIDVAAFAREHGTDFAAAEKLTDAIHDSLAAVLLEAESDELWRGLLLVAAWTDPAARDDLTVRQARAKELAEAYRRLVTHDPERATAAVDATRELIRELDAVGVVDPLALDDPPSLSGGTLVRFLAPTVLLAPFALVGAVLAYLPYRLVRPVAVRFAGENTDLVGTIKLLLGLVVLTATYVGEAAFAGMRFGVGAGFATALVAPLLGFVALRYGERIALRQQVLRGLWIRATADERLAAIRSRRQRLVTLVREALQTPGL